MTAIFKKFLVAGDKFNPEMHRRHAEFMYSVC